MGAATLMVGMMCYNSPQIQELIQSKQPQKGDSGGGEVGGSTQPARS